MASSGAFPYSFGRDSDPAFCPPGKNTPSAARMKFGYLPDLPDARDYTSAHPKVAPYLKKPASAPASADLRPFCPPICDQGQIGSCTANAAAALCILLRQNASDIELRRSMPILEYYRRKSELKTSPLSRMFIYKATRDLMQSRGDSGAYIRTTMGALALFGALPRNTGDMMRTLTARRLRFATPTRSITRQ